VRGMERVNLCKSEIKHMFTYSYVKKRKSF